MEWMLMPLRRYADFSGRSRRKEYWMYALGLILLYVVTAIIFLAAAGSAFMNAASDPTAAAGLIASLGVFGLVFGLVWLALIIPSLAVGVRRLHVPIAPAGGWRRPMFRSCFRLSSGKIARRSR